MKFWSEDRTGTKWPYAPHRLFLAYLKDHLNQKFFFSDFERGFMIAHCLMGSNMTECDQLEDTLVSMAMNATDMLAEQCKIVSIALSHNSSILRILMI